MRKFHFLRLSTNRRQCENFLKLRQLEVPFHVRTALRPAAFSHRRVLASLQLPDRRPDLPDGESAAARAAPRRAHQAAPARPLGHVAGAEFYLRASQPADSRARRQHHLYIRSRPRRSVGHVAHLSRRHVLRDLSADFRGRRGHAPAVPPILVAGRRAESCGPARARLDQRRRRARLLAGACVRRGVRQSRSDCRVRDRRRRGGNRAARRRMEGRKVSEPDARRRGAADPPSERLQNFRSHRVRPRRRRGPARACSKGHGYEVHFVEGDDPPKMHREFAATLDQCYATIRAIQTDARANGLRKRPTWPAIVLRSLKGWTGPKVVDGVQIEGTFRAHQVPLAGVTGKSRAFEIARTVDAQLPARRVVR